MDRFKKLLIIAIVAAYVVYPIDDLLVMLLGWATSRKLPSE